MGAQPDGTESDVLCIMISPEFEEYLANLPEQKVVPATKRFLRSLYQLTGVPVPDPQALLSEYGYMALAWEKGNDQFSVEVFPNGKLDWFWRDSLTEEVLADEGVSVISPEFIERFANAIEEEANS